MNKAIIGIVLAAAIMALLIPAGRAQATVHIFTNDSLPRTLGSAYSGDTIRFAGTSVHTTGQGLVVNGANVFIDGQGDTLFYNSNGIDFAYGITVAYSAGGFSMRDLTVYHDENAASNTREATCLWLENPDGVNLKRCRFVCFGYDVRCVDSYGGGVLTKNVVIDSCHFYNYSDSYASRHSYGGAAVRLEMRGTFTGSDFGAHIYNSVVHISPHAGIALLGNYTRSMPPGIEIARCTTYVDHRNVGGSSANAYGILLHDCRAPLSIHDNAILSGTKYGGSRGLMLENLRGTASDWINIYNNRIETSSGPDAENPGGVNRVLRIRSLDGGWWDYIHVHDNTLIATTDNLSSTTHIGTDASVFQFGAFGTDAGHAHAIFERNHVEYRALTSGTDGTAAEFSVESTYPGVPPITIRHNKYLSSQRVVWTADEYNAQSSHDLTFFEDTLGFIPPGGPGILVNPVTWSIGYYLENDHGERAVNCYYVNGADEKDIRLYPNGGSHEFSLVQQRPIVAVGNNDSLVASFNLRVVNGKGTQILNTVVTDGMLLPDLTYWYESTSLGAPVDYNPFTITVKSGTDSTVTQHTLNYQTTSVVLSLPNTRGTLPLDYGGSPLGNVNSFTAKLVATDRIGESDLVELRYQIPAAGDADSVVAAFSTANYPDSLAIWRAARNAPAGLQVTDTVSYPVVEPANLFISYWTRTTANLWSARGQTSVYVVDTIPPVQDTVSVGPIR